MTLHAGDSLSAPSRTVTLEGQGMESGMFSRVPVEVRAEGTSNIVIEYVGTK